MRPTPLVPAGVVLLALGGIAAAAQFAGPAGPAGPAAPAGPGPGHVAMAPQQVAVTSAARACPPVQGGGSGQVAFIAGSPVASRGAGQAQLAPLPLAGAQLRTLNPISQTQPGLLSMLTTPAAQSTSKKPTTALQGWAVTPTRPPAQTIEGEETTRARPAHLPRP